MSFFGSVGHWFAGLWKAISGQLQQSLETFLKSFVVDDLGALAVDAVEYVATLDPSMSDADKKAAAIATFKADAIKAGKDIEAFGESLFNFFIETALQAVKAGLGTAATDVKTDANGPGAPTP